MEAIFSLKRRVSPIVSSEAAECGLACFTMVARYYGHDVDLPALRAQHPISFQGMRLRGLMELGDLFSLSARALKIELADLAQLKVPVILHWNLNHFVVLISATSRTLTICDPAHGKRVMSLSEASKHFTGVVLQFTPVADFTPVSERTEKKLSRLWRGVQGVKLAAAQVLSLTAILQILAFAAPFHLQISVDQVLARDDRQLPIILAVAFLCIALIRTSVELVRGWTVSTIGALINYQIVGNIVHHLFRLPADFFEKRHVGDLLSRMASARTAQDILVRGVATGVLDGVMAIAAAVLVVFYSPLLAGIVFAGAVVSFASVALVYPALREAQLAQISAGAREQSHLMESIRASVLFKIMGGAYEREGRWRNLFVSYCNNALNAQKISLISSAVQNISVALQSVAIVYFGTRLVAREDGFSLGMLFSLSALALQFNDRVVSLANQALQMGLIGMHLDRVSEITSATPEAAEIVSVTDRPVRGAIEMRDVSFRYGTADRWVLRDINLDIAPGDFVAITGPSGGGKTTLVKLLLGLHRASAGEVLLDGEVAEAGLWQAWRRRVGLVAQDDRLLSGSIGDNISFFDPRGDLARIEEAARLACVDEDIRRMPMRYHSLVGDMGSSLSGGQRQRILLARALYRNPAILILDEGTANLDPNTEERIADVVDGLPITRIVVAHRPALIQRAHRTLSIVDGELTEASTVREGAAA